MELDQDLLERFEAGLNPQQVAHSSVPAAIIGYGEISAIFRIAGDTTVAYKRLPLFLSRQSAREYAGLYDEYCRLLLQAGLHLPESGTAVVAVPDRPVVLYIAQRALPAACFGHHLIHDLSDDGVRVLIKRIVNRQKRIQAFNRTLLPALEIALDGQLSNWAFDGDDIETGTVYFVDTSTPLIRRQGKHQLDPGLLLRAVPFPLRRLTERFLANDVMDRYFDFRQNLIDLVANLFKEQRPDLISLAVAVINDNLPEELPPLNEKEIVSYYRIDKHIWGLFLALRKMDRFLVARVFRKRYEFILPEGIKR
jgi:hypothetical protein